MVLMGCVNTANTNDVQEPIKTTPAANIDSSSQQNTLLSEADNKSIQDIESQVKLLEKAIETLIVDNVRLLEQSEQYKKVSSESKTDAVAVGKLKTQVKQLKQSNGTDISLLTEEISVLKGDIKQLNQVVNNKEQLSQANKNNILELTNTVDGLSKLIDETNSDIKSYQNTSSNEHATDIKSLWMSLIALLVLTLGLLIGFMLFRKTTKAELSATKQNLDSECNKIDMKLTELLESQVETMDLLQPRSTAEQEHSIPLKVLTEIHRMKNRLAAMPQDTKGLKPLGKAVGRIEENLKEKGYEMIDLFGEKFIDGMTVNQEFIFDENLSLDEKIISKVVKPQINFNGTLIQLSDVIVSIGE
jgi:DNA repair exonuclease SbcCD ATPase subunit